jgi:hypothetical protein
MSDRRDTGNNDKIFAVAVRRELLRRRDLIKLGAGAALAGLIPTAFGQAPVPQTGAGQTIYTNNGYAETNAPDPTQQAQQPLDTVYVCPMDPDVRSNAPGVCPRCGMTLVAGIPDYSSEYRMDVTLTPKAPKPGENAKLDFAIFDPWKNRPVRSFEIVHERLFHLFLVSQDLSFFVHDHPELNADGTFTYKMAFPKAGMYRALADIYPVGGTPQLIPSTVFIPGANQAAFTPVSIPSDYSPKDTENMHVEISSNPAQPVAGMKTILYFNVSPVEGFEQYLGAWAHMLAASDDLVDLIHTHPTIADGTSQLQFNMILPRARTYRIWIQFQRKGVVNTARFDVVARSIDQLM